MTQSAPPPPPQSSGNKKWILFGCGGCLGLLVIAAIAVGFFFWSITGVLKKSEPYLAGLNTAQASPEVQGALGTPIEAGFFTTGAVTSSNAESTAALVVRLAGPNGKGTLIIEGSKSGGGAWQYSKQQVVVDGSSQIIDLLPEAAPALPEEEPATEE